MPQMILTDYPPQIVWLIVAFVLLYFLMTKVALPRISNIFEKREKRISKNIQEAEKLKKDAEKASMQYIKVINDAKTDAANILKDATKKISNEVGKRNETFLEDLKKKENAAEKRIEKAKNEAMSHVKMISTEVTEQIAKTLIGEDNFNKEELKRVIQKSVEKEENV